MELICPLCGEMLKKTEKSLICPNRHSFDIARQGYVHLLPVQSKHSSSPGDTREQVVSRRRFLEEGYYAPIARAVTRAALDAGIQGEILDVGCGEGYYGAQLAEALGCPLTGVDISKEAVRCAAGKYKGHTWLCASAAHLPVEDGSVSLLTALFSVTLPGEFRRVLREDGYFIQVLAAPDHLLGLKGIIYDRLTEKPKDSVPELPGFTLVKTEPIRFSFTVEGEQVQNLLAMTPHVYRIGPRGAARLRETERLTDTASCVLNLCRRS
ncbi:MAG: methyltransferase domain-containing protein [Candidatus Faecousia sp.]|nr:methyltransferase domain-containing protein [Clostridiales bacterium]MDY6180176.1 methyltransferase domain-containing protein [Candidatus Faecousia sp.]